MKGHVIDGIWGTEGLHISAGGYLTFNRVISSDHRLLWVFIPLTEAFRGDNPPFRVPSTKKLRLNHSKGQSKYMLKMRLLTRKQNLLSRIKDLSLSYTHPPSPQAIKEYEKIDQITMSSPRSLLGINNGNI